MRPSYASVISDSKSCLGTRWEVRRLFQNPNHLRLCTHSPDKCTPIYIDIIPKYSTLAFDLKNKCKSINWQERGGIQKEAMKGLTLVWHTIEQRALRN